MKLKAAVALTLLVSSVASAETSVSSFTQELASLISSQGEELAINSAMDIDCAKQLPHDTDLRDSSLVFGVKNGENKVYPAWPLVCSYAVMADKVTTKKLTGGARQIAFTNDGESLPYLVLTLDPASLSNTGKAFSVIGMNNQLVTKPENQSQVMALMLDYYQHVVGG